MKQLTAIKPHKILEIPLFTFDQLSEEAKQNAVEEYEQNGDFFYGHEIINTLKKGAEYFGARLSNYEMDFGGYSRPSFATFELLGDAPTKGELKALIKGMGDYNKKTFKGKGDCKLTGVCFDEDFFDGVRTAYLLRDVTDTEDLLNAGFESLMEAAKKSYKYMFSIEGYAEHCEANQYTFEADGTMNNG